MHFAVEKKNVFARKVALIVLAPFFPLLICILFPFLQMANGESRLVAEEDEEHKKSFSDLTIIHQKKSECVLSSQY